MGSSEEGHRMMLAAVAYYSLLSFTCSDDFVDAKLFITKTEKLVLVTGGDIRNKIFLSYQWLP